LGAVAHVTVLDVVAVLPQPSIAMKVLVCELLQLVDETGPSLELTLTAPHASVAVAVPRAASMSEAVEPHPSVSVVPVAVMLGGVTSLIHVIVREVVAVLPQASIARNVLVCVAVQLLPPVVTEPSEGVIVTAPHPSVAVADPNAALISDAVGLQPSVVVVPFAVIVGGVRSLVQLIVLDAVAVLPQASIAINVLVCVAVQLLDVVMTAASVGVIVTAPHASVAVAEPSAALMSDAVGLHPSVVVPAAVIVGGVTSTILIVAGDRSHPAIVLAVPAAMDPHAALVTYLTLTL
jgi:hypothetical protein